MSYVDLSKNKIIGCKEGSLNWWHEVGHIQYNKTDLSVKLGYKGEFFLYLSIFFIILSHIFNGITQKLFEISSLIFISIFVLVFIYEELWCWVYAFKMKKEGNLQWAKINL
jgi:ammonia channel protein AmtB